MTGVHLCFCPGRPDAPHQAGCLQDAWFCGTCGRAKSYRLYGFVVGCPECDEAATRHRCAERPDLGALDVGGAWECPDCGSVWTAVMEDDVCGECGRAGQVKGWGFARGPRVEEAPRYDGSAAWAPFRPFLAEHLVRRERAELPEACYRAQAGFMVHVKDVCECAGRKK